MTVSPLDEYKQRRAARAAAHARLARTDARIASCRLTAVALTAVCVWLGVFYDGPPEFPPWLPVIPIAIFIGLAVWHDRVLHSADCMRRAVDFYDRGIARVEDRWQSEEPSGARFLQEDHLYARDLDLFGPASLFQLLSRARTHLGEELLARWLTTPADVTAIRLRQDAVAELRSELDFRESLAVAGGAASDIDTVMLSAWASRPAMPEPVWLRIAALALAAAILATLVLWLRGGPIAPLVAALLLKMFITRPSKKRVARVVRGVETPLGQLDVLADTLKLVEGAQFRSERLAAIGADIRSHDVVPSQAIRRLKRLADMLDWRRNAFFAPIAALVSWPLHLASAIESWRQEFGGKVLAWLTAIAEYEVSSSLAAYSYEHPADPFPEFKDSDPAILEGRALGHPLVPERKMVRNDVLLTPQVRLLVVSGSNMSGKSTLLRTIGVNVVLAMAGAPVRAAQLVMTPLAVGATLHVHDSLQAGRSRFFAEISRIRAIVDLAGRRPDPIFLLDELFQGTNSHDRRIGAAAVLTNLIDHGAIGLATTHDLALTTIASHSNGRIVNVHFEDQLRNGELVFDYRMKPGPVTHSNALELMKALGLIDPLEDRKIGRVED